MPIMTPGTYLAKRRAAAGLSIEDVAERISTEPPIPHHDRAAWLRRIEQDVDGLKIREAAALSSVFPFDLDIFVTLIGLHSPVMPAETIEAPRLCQACGCSENDACLDPTTGQGCRWVGPEQCSACDPATPAGAVAAA